MNTPHECCVVKMHLTWLHFKISLNTPESDWLPASLSKVHSLPNFWFFLCFSLFLFFVLCKICQYFIMKVSTGWFTVLDVNYSSLICNNRHRHVSLYYADRLVQKSSQGLGEFILSSGNLICYVKRGSLKGSWSVTLQGKAAGLWHTVMIYVRNWAWGLIWACLYELWEQLIEVSHPNILQVQFLRPTRFSQAAIND